MGLQFGDDRACGFPAVDACRGDLDGGPLPVHVDDDHDPGSDALVTTMLTSAERSSKSRRSVTVQPSTAIGGCVTCGAQLPPRSGPYRAARLPRPAREPPSRPCRLSIAYPRMSGSAIHACTAATQGPRAERPDCSRTAGVGRHADAIAHRDRQIAPSADCADLAIVPTSWRSPLRDKAFGRMRSAQSAAAHGLAPEVQTEIRGKPLIGVPGQAIHANACACRESRPRSCCERVLVDDAADPVVASEFGRRRGR